MVGAGILAERAKPRLAMPASYITLLVQVLVGQSSLSLSVGLGKQHKMVQELGPLAPTGETLLEPQVPGFS